MRETSAARRTYDVGVLDAELLHEAQHPFRIARQRALVAVRTFGETATRQIDGVDGEIFGQRLHVEAPGKRKAQKAVNQQQRRSGPGHPIAPIHAVNGDGPLLCAMNFSDLRNRDDLWRRRHDHDVQPGRPISDIYRLDIASVAWGSRKLPRFSFLLRVPLRQASFFSDARLYSHPVPF